MRIWFTTFVYTFGEIAGHWNRELFTSRYCLSALIASVLSTMVPIPRLSWPIVWLIYFVTFSLFPNIITSVGCSFPLTKICLTFFVTSFSMPWWTLFIIAGTLVNIWISRWACTWSNELIFCLRMLMILLLSTIRIYRLETSIV